MTSFSSSHINTLCSELAYERKESIKKNTSPNEERYPHIAALIPVKQKWREKGNYRH